MVKYILIILMAASLLTSCENTIEDITTMKETVETETILNPGNTIVTSRGTTTAFLGYGSIHEENVSYPGGSSSFGVNLVIGENFSYDPITDEFSFDQDGKVEYYIVMSDNNVPLDTSLALEVGESYPADLIQMDVSSDEEFFEILDSEDWIGGGVEVVKLTVEEITDDYFRGIFEGSYPLNSTNEMVDITGEFNVERVK